MSTYIAIDLKSFYASVECVARGLDALSTHLVVADLSRTEKTICLAVTPALKAYGIAGRARLFEVVQRAREINRQRLRNAIRLGVAVRGENGEYAFRGKSADARELEADPSLALDYIVAPPRMKLYEQVSARIFAIYLRFVGRQDIHVYSIDECFLDVTGYLKSYGMSPRNLARSMIRSVLNSTGITATAGIGTNMYLAKVAMDIVAKHVPADSSGARIAELDERSYREQLWCHRPLTDFWRISRGIAGRMERLGCYTMGDIARLSLRDENPLYKALGINAELLIDHAWGREPTRIADVQSYRPSSSSISSGQVLPEPYNYKKGRLIVREMTELLAMDLVRKKTLTRKVELVVCYDKESLVPEHPALSRRGTAYFVASTGKLFTGTVGLDYYGSPVPKHAHGTAGLIWWTGSTRRIAEAMMGLYDRIVNPDLLIRRVYVVALDLRGTADASAQEPVQLDMFSGNEFLLPPPGPAYAGSKKEKALQETVLQLRERFGKNAVLKGMNLEEGGTTIQRNNQIGGHRA